MRRIATKVLYRVALLTAVLGVVGLVGACGDDDGNPSGNTVLIQAAEGGIVSMDGDETSINIPANALAQDTEIGLSYGNLTDYGLLENARSRVLLMEPAGTVLEIPAAVLVDPGSPAIGVDQIVTVRQWVDGGWYAQQAGTVVSGGLVSVTVSMLAPLAVVVEDPVVGPTGTISGMVIHMYTEMPLEGYTFELMQGDTVVDTVVSDVNGLFTFTEVGVGTYNVHAVVTIEENCYEDPVDAEAVVTEGQTTDVFFGFVPGPC